MGQRFVVALEEPQRVREALARLAEGVLDPAVPAAQEDELRTEPGERVECGEDEGEPLLLHEPGHADHQGLFGTGVEPRLPQQLLTSPHLAPEVLGREPLRDVRVRLRVPIAGVDAVEDPGQLAALLVDDAGQLARGLIGLYLLGVAR